MTKPAIAIMKEFADPYGCAVAGITAQIRGVCVSWKNLLFAAYETWP
jgi:hypothetical protein